MWRRASAVAERLLDRQVHPADAHTTAQPDQAASFARVQAVIGRIADHEQRLVCIEGPQLVDELVGLIAIAKGSNVVDEQVGVLGEWARSPGEHGTRPLVGPPTQHDLTAERAKRAELLLLDGAVVLNDKGTGHRRPTSRGR